MFLLVIFSFPVINSSETLSNNQKKEKKKSPSVAELHKVVSYNDVTFDVADHVKQINCDQISILL